MDLNSKNSPKSGTPVCSKFLKSTTMMWHLQRTNFRLLADLHLPSYIIQNGKLFVCVCVSVDSHTGQRFGLKWLLPNSGYAIRSLHNHHYCHHHQCWHNCLGVQCCSSCGWCQLVYMFHMYWHTSLTDEYWVIWVCGTWHFRGIFLNGSYIVMAWHALWCFFYLHVQ